LSALAVRVSPLTTSALLTAIDWYRLFLHPVASGRCRYYPSCSEYLRLAVLKYGPFAGVWKGVRRLGRCHPFHPGGVDFP
jgi:putative membrane protein insertion efficiency factor